MLDSFIACENAIRGYFADITIRISFNEVFARAACSDTFFWARDWPYLLKGSDVNFCLDA